MIDFTIDRRRTGESAALSCYRNAGRRLSTLLEPAQRWRIRTWNHVSTPLSQRHFIFLKRLNAHRCLKISLGSLQRLFLELFLISITFSTFLNSCLWFTSIFPCTDLYSSSSSSWSFYFMSTYEFWTPYKSDR